jgi:hypothetical protein
MYAPGVPAGYRPYIKRTSSYSKSQKAEGFLLLRGCFSRSICPKLYGDSYSCVKRCKT